MIYLSISMKGWKIENRQVGRLRRTGACPDSLEEESRTNREMRWDMGGWRLVKQWRWREVNSLVFSPVGSWYRAKWFSCLNSSLAPGVNPDKYRKNKGKESP